VLVFLRTFNRWVRDLHLYCGLFLSPFVLVYALSAILVNHAVLPWGGPKAAKASPKRTAAVRVPDDEDAVRQARAILAQIGVVGEVEFVRREDEGRRLVIPVVVPGRRTTVRVDAVAGRAEVEEKRTGVWDSIVYLHKMPGQHLVSIRGNWVFMRLWRWLADATVYIALFLSATGVYLWVLLKAERKTGLVFLGLGILSFVVVVAGLLG
jgi:hypothetical protein